VIRSSSHTSFGHALNYRELVLAAASPSIPELCDWIEMTSCLLETDKKEKKAVASRLECKRA
jgi:hypothetical protein